MVPASTRYRNVRAQIEDGDLLLFRRPKAVLSEATLGDYSHAAMALWRGDVLLMAESREWRGARIVTLSSQVRNNPGVIDVFRPRIKHEIAAEAADWMARHAGHEYSYLGIVRYAIHREVIFDLCFQMLGLIKNPQRYREPVFHEPKFCSEQVAWCYRRAAIERHSEFDPCPRMPSQFITPNDLSRGPFDFMFCGLEIPDDDAATAKF